MDWLLYMAVPIFVVGIGIFMIRRSGDPPLIGSIPNRAVGLFAIAIGGIDFTIRLLRTTVLR